MEGSSPPTKLEDAGLRCDVCDGPAYALHCKVICTRCGYTRDCSDP